MLLAFSESNRFLKIDLEEDKSSGAFYGIVTGQFDNFGFNKFVRIGNLELNSFLSSFCSVYEKIDGECSLFDDEFYRYFSLKFIATKSGEFIIKILYSTDDEKDLFRAEIEVEQSCLKDIYSLAKELTKN